jgi:hypothetical protein
MSLNNSTHKILLFFALLFVGFLLVKNAQSLIDLRDLKDNQISTIGDITDKYRGVRFFEGFVLYYSYTAVDGIQHLEKSRVSPNFWSQKKIGDTVSIIYHSKNNKVARIDTPFDVKNRNYILHVGLMSIGIMITIIYLIKSLKSEKNKHINT